MDSTGDSSQQAEAGGRNWLVPVGGALGLIVGNGPISLFAFAVFIGPLEREFGWSRASLGVATAMCALLSAISLPIVGVLMDRFGVRRPMAIAILLFGLNVAVIGQSSSLAVFIALTALAGVTGAAQSPIGYVKSIASYFDRKRGLAIGIAMSGIGIGTALVPQYVQWLVGTLGWRMAYVGLGVAIVALGLPSVLFLLREPPRGRGAAMAQLLGLSLREVVRGRTFWSLAIAVLLVSIAANGALVHVVPLLVERGWSPAAATSVLGAAGAASLVGRLLAGYLMDKVHATYVASAFFALAIVGLYLLASGTNAVLGMIAIGLAAGAEVDMIGFFISRYFGLKHFGQLYGVLFAIFTIGAGLGPLLLGTLYTHLHDYTVGFIICGVGLVVASLSVLTLGAYSYEPIEGRTAKGKQLKSA